MATEESTKELGNMSPKNSNSASRKERHKSGLEPESSLRMALFTCITTRQLKIVLDLCNELEKRRASGCNDGDTNVDALINSLSKKKATRRVKGSVIPRSRSRSRKKQPDGALEVKTNEAGTVEFDVASINIGSFVLKKPAKQEYCYLNATNNGVIDSMTSLYDASDVDVSEGQRESSLSHVIHLREGTTSTWEEALLRGNRTLFETIIRGSAQMDLSTITAQSTARTPQMAVLERMEPNSLSSLSGESMEGLDLDHLHSMQQSRVFEPTYNPNIGLVDSTTLSSALNDGDNFDKPLSKQDNPAQFGNMECVSVPDIRLAAGKFICDGHIVSSEQQGSVPISMLLKRRLPKPDQPPPIKKFISEATVNKTERGKSSTMRTDSIDLERIEKIIQSVEHLIRHRNMTVEARIKRLNDRGTNSLQPPQMSAKQHNSDSFYWLNDIDMDKLAVNYDASNNQ